MRIRGGGVVTTTVGSVIAAVALICVANASPESSKDDSPAGQAPRRAGSVPAFGFNDEPLALLRDVPAQLAAGATVARVPLPAFFVDLCCGHTWFDWTLPDRIYRELLAAGIKPIFSVWGTPPYVGDGPHERPGDAPQSFPDLDWWAGFNARLAQRYPRAILQVWNEPNQPAFGSFTVEQTVTLTTVAEQAIHAVNPTQRVIGPATSPGMPGWQPFLRQVYERLPESVRVDASIHLYPGGTNPIRMLRRQYSRLAKFDREVWVTEVGISQILYPTTQAKWTGKVYRALDSFGAKGIIFHRLSEPSSGQEWEFRARLWALDLTGEPTGIFHALRSVTRH